MLKIFKSYHSNKEKEIRRKELKFGLLSGIALGLSFPPVPLPYLIFLALIPYFFVIEKRESLAGINRFTYFTAFFFNIITLYWVGSWTPDADPFLMVAGTVLMFFNPVVFLIPSTLFYFTKKYLNFKTALFLMPWFWLFYEYIYSVSDFKFPWLSLSNSLPYFNMYIQIADILGSYGLSVLVIYVNIFAYLTIKTYMANNRIDLKYLSLFIAFFLFPIIYGLIRLNLEYSTELKVKVGLVQPDLNPNKKWEIGNLNEQVDLYDTLSNKALEKGAEIVV